MKNLSVQELADELGVSRQLIYYHAKKIKEDEKVYDETNRLVFTPEQQLKLQSFMTLEDDETQESKESEDVLQDVKVEKDDKDSKESLESQEAVIEVKEVTVQIDKPEQLSFELDDKDELKEVAEEDTSQGKKDDKAIENQTIIEEVKDSEQKETHETEKSNTEDENKETFDPEMNENVTDFIRTYVRKYMDQDDDPAQTMEQYFKLLEQQLYEKDLHIDRLAKLLDQQQQLLLIEQQKNIQLRLEYSNMSHAQDSKEDHKEKVDDSQEEKDTSPHPSSNTQETNLSSQSNANESTQPSTANSKPSKKWWQFWK
ncbi:HTH domain-containing protein [Dolosicoccus paucivorans]|uniref:HTH domain-containing protein n=1 Tax=Dolosicoccus paucivorans TaxID=84521 RepID=A0A1G8K836_9LACT|nr:HTH domain-containing protein [Dolosicoccus paucivorans]PMB84726.1 HTH domain-containing protein [Dolosicoccus paucivorans]PMC58805.1 HTH domain-containing protein [Dolosicoccus paucivorans]SDI38970.1 HTH domain-containing protein [Dolosicoccus paucivorans]